MLLCVLGNGELHAQRGLQSLEKLTVYDGGGKKVGTVLRFAGYPPVPVVAFSKDAITAVLIAWRDKLRGTETSFYFTSANCTGTAYLSLADRVPPTVVWNNVIYVPDTTFPPSDITVNSILRNPGEAFEDCFQIAPEPRREAVPPRILVDLSGYFTPPFIAR
jgi:hypothetical protein